jgi:hypothetical protein
MVRITVSLVALFVSAFLCCAHVVQSEGVSVIQDDAGWAAVMQAKYALVVSDIPGSKMSARVKDEVTTWMLKCSPIKLAVYSVNPKEVLSFRDFLVDQQVKMEVIAYGNPREYIFTGSGTLLLLSNGRMIRSEQGLLITVQNRIEGLLRSTFPGMISPQEPLCHVGGQAVPAVDEVKTDL